ASGKLTVREAPAHGLQQLPHAPVNGIDGGSVLLCRRLESLLSSAVVLFRKHGQPRRSGSFHQRPRPLLVLHGRRRGSLSQLIHDVLSVRGRLPRTLDLSNPKSFGTRPGKPFPSAHVLGHFPHDELKHLLRGCPSPETHAIHGLLELRSEPTGALHQLAE